MDRRTIIPENIVVICGAQGSGKTTLLNTIFSAHSAEIFKVAQDCLTHELRIVKKVNTRKALILIDEVNLDKIESLRSIVSQALINTNWTFILFTNQAISFAHFEWQRVWYISPVTSEGYVNSTDSLIPNPGICKAHKCAHLVDNKYCKYDKFCGNKQKISINGTKRNG